MSRVPQFLTRTAPCMSVIRKIVPSRVPQFLSNFLDLVHNMTPELPSMLQDKDMSDMQIETKVNKSIGGQHTRATHHLNFLAVKKSSVPQFLNFHVHVLYISHNIYAAKKNPAPHFVIQGILIQCLDSICIYMYICLYVYMYICIYVYLYICIYVYVSMYICI